MIKLNINIDSALIMPDQEKYDQDVSDSLQVIANLVPNHKSNDFNDKLWGVFKHSIWEQQNHKCAYCEKEIVSSDDGQVEHFRPKTVTHDEQNKQITREAYWWLAYDHKNYLVSCSTCNGLKGNRFPIKDENNRVKAANMNTIIELTNEGILGNEIPYTINPRYIDPAPHLAYNFRPDTRIVFTEPKDDDGVGEKTIMILDLNRKRKNKEIVKDFLPYKRGCVLSEFREELEKFHQLKGNLNSYRSTLATKPDNKFLKKIVLENESEVKKKLDIIRERFLSKSAQFSGMCNYWLVYDTPFKNDFIEGAV